VGHTFRKPLPPDEQLALVKRAQRGDLRARHLLTETSMAFVYHVAGKFSRGRKDVLDDMVGAGVVGLLEALDRFDLKRSNRFLTYAGPWVRMRMHERMLADASPLGGGRSAYEQDRTTMNAYNRARALGLENSEAIEETAKETGRTESDVRDRVARRRRTFGHESFDAPIGNDAATLGETFVSPDEPVDEVLSDEEGRRALRARLAQLKFSEKERAVVEHRLMGGESLGQVAARLGVSRQRVQQIEAKLVVRLRKYLAPDLVEAQPLVLGSAFSERLTLPASVPTSAFVPRSGAAGVERSVPAPRAAPLHPKPPAERLCRCSHPESWHGAGPCGHGCGCVAFDARWRGRSPSAIADAEDDLAPGSCPAVKSEKMHRPCGRPAIYGALCVFHGMRAERGEEVLLYVPLRESVDRLWPSMTEDERIVAKSYVLEHEHVDHVARLIHDTRTQVHHLAASLTKRLRAAERSAPVSPPETVTTAAPHEPPPEMGKVLLFRRAREGFQRRTAT